MNVLTPTARLEVLGTRFDVVANSEGVKLIIREGAVNAVRTSDGQSVKVEARHSTIANTNAKNVFHAELTLNQPTDGSQTWSTTINKANGNSSQQCML